MNIVKWILNAIKSLKRVDTKGFEKEYINFWLAYQHKDDGIVMPYFLNHVYVKYKVGDIVKVAQKDDIVAYYEIKGMGRNGSTYGDYAGWDDNKIYNLMFDHIDYATEIEIDVELEEQSCVICIHYPIMSEHCPVGNKRASAFNTEPCDKYDEVRRV